MIYKIKDTSNLVQLIEADYIKQNLPVVNIGDTVKIQKIIQEGNKERVQLSEGVIISKKNSGINKTMTMRKTIQNIGVERVYLMHSPHIIKIEIIKQAKIRKSKLYYLRSRSGKATRLKQK
uniref:Large ribosomal subunit protein bL19c n=1 Tax=Polysiphonia infestans TaxID=2006978 RepID=A0A1Z1MEH9_9FLOR|nr:ribosomal protein L19 [Polysiphonia infestans]ARW64440.1 ribosomal protein L19 [Polysiphonia infestans]